MNWPQYKDSKVAVLWFGLRFGLALLRSELRNCGLCVIDIQKHGATLLVGASFTLPCTNQ